MASDTHRWPWKLDSSTFAAEFPGPPAGLVTTQRMAPGTVLWVSNAAGAGDQVILSDNEGHIIWESQAATGADFADDYKFPDSVAFGGLVITQLPSGLVFWYFR